MASQTFLARSRIWTQSFLDLISKAVRRSVLSLVLIPTFGGWMLAMWFCSKTHNRESRQNAGAANGDPNYAGQQAERSLLRRLSDSPLNWLRKFCSPSSSHIPLGSGVLIVLYGVRAMENHQLSLPSTEDNVASCPENSRRTITGVFVKLFAATVTTIGVHGHLNSLNGGSSWKLELFRAFELCTIPLASVLSFIEAFWYSFVDLLMLSPGPWKSGTTARYRFARFGGCCVQTRVPLDTGLRYFIGSVSPCHLEVNTLKRDLRWGGRLLTLIVLIGQYSQAAALMIRRILFNTAAGIDYAMFFLAISGLTALVRSLTISLLNVSWTLKGDIQACTEPVCQLPGCIAFKKGQGLPGNEHRLMVFGQNLVFVPRRILHAMAGGFLQCSIVLRREDSLVSNITTLCFLQLAWRSTIYNIFALEGFWDLVTEHTSNDITQLEDQSGSQTTGSLPGPGTQEREGIFSKPFTVFHVLIALTLSIVGVAALAWLCLLLCVQLAWLILPMIAMYSRITLETVWWKQLDTTQPCLQLWKDRLEDELWWF